MQGLSYPVYRIFNSELTILKTKVLDTLPAISNSLFIYSEICIINSSTIMNAIGTYSINEIDERLIYTIKMNMNLDIEVVNSYKRADLFSLPNSILPYQTNVSYIKIWWTIVMLNSFFFYHGFKHVFIEMKQVHIPMIKMVSHIIH